MRLWAATSDMSLSMSRSLIPIRSKTTKESLAMLIRGSQREAMPLERSKGSIRAISISTHPAELITKAMLTMLVALTIATHLFSRRIEAQSVQSDQMEDLERTSRPNILEPQLALIRSWQSNRQSMAIAPPMSTQLITTTPTAEATCKTSISRISRSIR